VVVGGTIWGLEAANGYSSRELRATATKPKHTEKKGEKKKRGVGLASTISTGEERRKNRG